LNIAVAEKDFKDKIEVEFTLFRGTDSLYQEHKNRRRRRHGRLHEHLHSLTLQAWQGLCLQEPYMQRHPRLLLLQDSLIARHLYLTLKSVNMALLKGMDAKEPSYYQYCPQQVSFPA
jgi:hypothetical protein